MSESDALVTEPIAAYEIENLMPEMQRIVAELSEAFDKGIYNVLIGDDISGRIPTLILRGVIDHINKKHGRPPIPLVFVKGNLNGIPESEAQKLTNALQQVPETAGKHRALLVTDFINSGTHLQHFGELIHQTGWSYDVASLWSFLISEDFRKAGILAETESIFPSQPSMKLPFITGARALTGLRRQDGRTVADRSVPAPIINGARVDVQKSIQQIISAQRL